MFKSAYAACILILIMFFFFKHHVIIHRVNCNKIRPCLGFVKFTVQFLEWNVARKEFGTESNNTTVTYLIHLS